MDVLNTSHRAPLYLSLITICTALAATTQLWVGVLGFAATALVLKTLGHFLAR